MANKTFFEAFGATINEAEIAKKGGLSYLSAATAMRLAGRPEVTFVDFDGKPHLEMLGGSVVAVDLQVPGSDAVQRMWLPVMDRDNQTLAIAKTQVTDINNSRQRCLVKAIAAVYGDGLSLYLGCDGNGAQAVKLLGVAPETDLETVTPVVATLKEGGAPYIEWGVGLAACRITDPTFVWEVVLWNGLPYREVLGGLMVDVDTVYDGMRQRLSLPVMDAAFNPLPASKATVFDWNKTVMRGLTKCIAFNSGYGLGVYADEFGNENGSKGRKGSAGKGAKQETAAQSTEAAPVGTATQADVASASAASNEAVAENVAAAAALVAETVADAQAAAAAEAVAEAPADAAEAPVDAVADSPAEVIAANAESDDAIAEVAAEVAAEAADAVADAQAQSTPVGDSDAVARFRDVMRKRREVGGVPAVVALYDALATSTKFADADKPNCFAVLVTASASIVDADNIVALLGVIKQQSAMRYLALDSRDIVAAKLTSVMLTAACAAGDEVLKTAPDDLVSAGVAQDVTDVLRLAAIGNVPVETMDLLRDVLDSVTA